MDNFRCARISRVCDRIEPHHLPSIAGISWDHLRSAMQLKHSVEWETNKVERALLTSDIMTRVVTLCSEIIRQKSPIVFSSGSWAMMKVSLLS